MRYIDFIANQEDVVNAPNELNFKLADMLNEKWEAMHLVLFDLNPRLSFNRAGTPSVYKADLPDFLEAIGRRVTVLAICLQ